MKFLFVNFGVVFVLFDCFFVDLLAIRRTKLKSELQLELKTKNSKRNDQRKQKNLCKIENLKSEMDKIFIKILKK